MFFRILCSFIILIAVHCTTESLARGAEGSISGQIVNTNNEPISGIVVGAFNFDTDAFVNAAFTNSEGAYLIPNLESGNYQVRIDVVGTDYALQFYNGVSSFTNATPVTVNDPENTPDINFSLVKGGSISGNVSDVDGKPVSGLFIDAFVFGTDNIVSFTNSDSSGNYKIIGLPPGAYRVRLDGSGTEFPEQFYDNVLDKDQASPINVTSNTDSSGINFILNSKGSISGFVKDHNNQIVTGVTVEVYDFDTNAIVDSIQPDSSGNYIITDLLAGRYKVGVNTAGTIYGKRFFDNAATLDDADLVNVEASKQTSNVNFFLRSTGSISGTVKDLNNNSISDMIVEALDFGTNKLIDNVMTDGSGNYTIADIPTGNYSVRVNTIGTNFDDQYYNQVDSRNLATAVTVTEKSDTSDIDFVLSFKGSISGTVKSVNNVAVTGMAVGAFDFETNEFINSAVTNRNGGYSITDIPSGSYIVLVDISRTNFAIQFFDEVATFALATSVIVNAPDDTSSIDFILKAAGTINGKVTDLQNNPVPDIFIDAVNVDTRNLINFGQSDSSGNYNIIGLPSGNYFLRADTSGTQFDVQFFNNASTIETATAVTVTASANTSNIDFALGSKGSLSGVVKDASNKAIQGLTVAAFDFLTDEFANSAVTDSEGLYTITNLSTGDYRVNIDIKNSDFAIQFFNDAPTFATADPVAVVAPVKSDNINFVLEFGGSVSGKVLDENNQPVDELFVNASVFETEDFVTSDKTDSSGNYTINGLSTGRYIVDVDTAGKNFEKVFYDNVVSIDLAAPVAVTALNETLEIDFQLASEKSVLKGSIVGKITNKDSNKGMENGEVKASSTEFEEVVVLKTDSDGNYKFELLPIGDYSLRVTIDGFEPKFIEKVGVVDGESTTLNIELTPLNTLGIVAGLITDVETKDGIVDVQVVDSNGVFSTTSLNDGSYILSGLPEGIYGLEVSANGFVTETVELVAVLKGNSTIVDFSLTPLPPKAKFSETNNVGNLPLIVTFKDESEGRTTEWLWTFGDGDSSTEQNPEHVYAKAGIFNVILTVTSPGGADTVIKPNLVAVTGPPIAEFETIVTAGFKTFFLGINNLSTGDISTVLWDFGDGNTSEEINPLHSYGNEGIYTVTLDVSGPGGADTMLKKDFINVLPITAPLAAFSAFKTAGFNPLEIQFSDLSSGKNIKSWLWDFGDGTFSSLQSPFHIYTSDGDFNVSLTIEGDGGVSTITKINFIKVLPVGVPNVDFSVDKTVAFAPIEVQFTDFSEGADLKSWLWDFGDGAISSGRSPLHEYKEEGIYSPTLTVIGQGGVSFEKKINLISAISTDNPIAEFSATPTVFFAPDTVTFTDISEGNEISSWFWNFGDGSVSTEQNPTHVYEIPGNFTVTLTVSNENGAGRETKLNLINVIAQGSPLADFSASPLTGSAPLDVQFNELAEPTDEIDNFFWNFGDGGTSINRNPKHRYNREGFFNVNLAVSNVKGANTREKNNLIIIKAAEPPESNFITNKTTGEVPLIVRFTDLSVGEIDSWNWLFGDGNVSSEQNPVHTYNKPGIFFVSLTVSGPGGADEETKNNLITVDEATSNPNDNPNGNPNTGDEFNSEFSADPTVGSLPLEVQFSDLSNGDIVEWLWDFGDGENSTEQNPTHLYNERGKYKVSLTVSDGTSTETEVKNRFITVKRKTRRGPK